MSDYKIPIIVGLIYVALLVIFNIVRTITVITIIFLALHFLFHGAFVLLGKRAEHLHEKFVQTKLATISVLSMYAMATAIYFVSRNILV